jgi:hypothetical protein
MHTHAPPGNGEGALQQAPPPNLTGAAAYHACSSQATFTERMPAGHVHYAALRCAACGAFIGWLPKPETIERRRLNGFRLARLLMCGRPTSWERHFVGDVSQRKRVSPRQQKIIDRLCADYVKKEATS